MTVYNFSAGPAILPKSVLKKAQEELLDYQGSQLSVMEMSHRSSLYESIINEAEQRLRQLMAIPENYHVLFLQGGASLQFSMLPLNLAKGKKALYVNTGAWAKKAIAAAEKAGTEYVFVEAALLIEEKYDEICDELWYIYADEEVRKERLIEGRGYSEKKVREIMANQLSEDEFSSHCDFEIDNSGDFEETKKQLDHRMKKYETL